MTNLLTRFKSQKIQKKTPNPPKNFPKIQVQKSPKSALSMISTLIIEMMLGLTIVHELATIPIMIILFTAPIQARSIFQIVKAYTFDQITVTISILM